MNYEFILRELILLMFPIFLSINVVAFDYESYNKGVKAFEIADYEEAMRFWKAALPKENERANALKEVKLLCKEFGRRVKQKNK